MVLGIERINARRQQPNSRIVFIKPLPGPTEAFAQDFLERVAAICHPIMKANHLSVMSLEEYEPNPEFIGRNFNAGEVIQLVLKAPYTGHWMSFRSVVMVMMHELAHCKQMNHFGAFWKVRNQFAGEMKDLWSKGYSGDGFWSRGKTLLSGQYEPIRSAEAEVLPRSLCGGTFRSSQGRKRKRKGEGPPRKRTLSYAERQQRRIAKKFGENGVTLGDNKNTREKLEKGKMPKGKPRVAGSARGRELRAAAALARFGQQQDELVKEDEEVCSESDTDSDYRDVDVKTEAATDLDGSRLVDSKGHGMVKICEDENGDDVHVKEEMQELQDINDTAHGPGHREHSHKEEDPSTIGQDDIDNTAQESSPPTRRTKALLAVTNDAFNLNFNDPTALVTRPSESIEVSCPICSMSNTSLAMICIACSHVLDTNRVHGHWRCPSITCLGSSYINSADCGICGVCGSRRSPT